MIIGKWWQIDRQEKKTFIRKCAGAEMWVEHPNMSLKKKNTQTHVEFVSMHPEIKISRQKFENLKHYFVKGQRNEIGRPASVASTLNFKLSSKTA